MVAAFFLGVDDIVFYEDTYQTRIVANGGTFTDSGATVDVFDNPLVNAGDLADVIAMQMFTALTKTDIDHENPAFGGCGDTDICKLYIPYMQDLGGGFPNLIFESVEYNTFPHMWSGHFTEISGFNSLAGENVYWMQTSQVTAVPLPAALLLFLAGLFGFIGIARKKT